MKIKMKKIYVTYEFRENNFKKSHSQDGGATQKRREK